MESAVLFSLLASPMGIMAAAVTERDLVLATIALGIVLVPVAPLAACLRSRLAYARRYELWTDALVVLGPSPLFHPLGRPRKHVPFTQIRAARVVSNRGMASWYDISDGAPGGWTSPGTGQAIWIDLSGRWESPLILTPTDPDAFLEALNKAMDAAKQP
jgi:hypothetical protein